MAWRQQAKGDEGRPIGTSEYEYDLLDRLTSYTPPLPSSTEVTYEYNNLNQKTSMTISGASPTSYGYYANGWLKSVSGGGVPDLATYTYNPVGNRTRIDYDSGTATTYSYDTDPRYRISSIAHDPVYGDTLTISYTRDNVGNPTVIAGTSYDFGTAPYDYHYKGERKWVCFDTHIFCKKRRVVWWVEWRSATKIERKRIPVVGPLPIGEGSPEIE